MRQAGQRGGEHATTVAVTQQNRIRWSSTVGARPLMIDRVATGAGEHAIAIREVKTYASTQSRPAVAAGL